MLRLARAAVLPGEGRGTDLVPPIEEATRTMAGGGIVAICSDFQRDGWLEALRRLGRRCGAVASHQDPAEVAPLQRH